MQIKLRTFVFVLIIFLVILFAAVNWPLFTTLSPMNLLFGTVIAPLGVVMLAVVGGLSLLYLILIGSVEADAFMGNRRTTKELDETRRLALSAEESRLTELRTELEERLARIEEKVDDVLARTEPADLSTTVRREPVRVTNGDV